MDCRPTHGWMKCHLTPKWAYTAHSTVIYWEDQTQTSVPSAIDVRDALRVFTPGCTHKESGLPELANLLPVSSVCKRGGIILHVHKELGGKGSVRACHSTRWVLLSDEVTVLIENIGTGTWKWNGETSNNSIFTFYWTREEACMKNTTTCFAI